MIYQEFNSQNPYHFDLRFYDDFNFVEHLHEDYELIYVIKGSLKLSLFSKEVIINEDEFALVLSNQIHSYQSLNNTKVWVGVFAKDFIKEFHINYANKEGKNIIFNCDDSSKEYLFNHLIYNQNPSRYELIACFNIVVASYLKNNEFKEISSQDKNNLVKILSFIAMHYNEEITLKDIANEFHFEMHYLSRYFHQYIPLNFKEFLNRYRLGIAKELLLTTNSISEACFNSGFQSLRSFNRAFKEIIGMTPKEYKEKK